MSNTLVISGLDDAITNLGLFVEDMDQVAYESVDAVLTTVENEMSRRASTEFNKYAEGVLQNSISHNVTMNETGVFGSVGVYDMSNKTKSGDRRLESPHIARFLEGGVQPHSLAAGVDAPKKGTPSDIAKDYNREAKSARPDLWHPGFEANPFMRLSFFNNVDKIGIETVTNLDKAATKL